MTAHARMRLAIIALATAFAADPSWSAAPTSGPEAILYTKLCGVVAATYDTARGGWVTRGGEEVPGAVALGFAQERDHGPALWKACALFTVNWTWTLYDSVGGGFYQRLDNTKASSSSFEKRTDSNAERLEDLIEAYRATGDEKYRHRAAQVADYFDRVLLDGRGGFIDGQVGDRNLVPRSNGMAIHAWLQWAAVNGDPHVRDFALLSLDRAWKEEWQSPFGMLRKGTFGEIEVLPQFIDQVEMGRAYVLGAHIGGRAVDLERAEQMGEQIERVFADPKKGCWGTQASADKHEKIKLAACDPLENARGALFMCELASVSGKSRWREAAQRVINAYSKDIGKAGLGSAQWALAVRALGGADLPPKPEWKAAAEVKPTPRSKSYGKKR
jgi:uncharacterized protein YyaL (SSP411 family)